MTLPAPPPDRRNRVLKAVCGVLIAFVTSHLVLQFASIPRYYERVTTGTVPTVVLAGEPTMSNALVAHWASERGMTLQTYALYSIALNVTITLGFASVAVLILWKARRVWFHWFTAFVLLFYPTGGLWEFTMVAQVAYRYVALGSLLWPAFPLFLYLFPTGRAVPWWTRWFVGALAALHLVLQAMALVAIYAYGPDELLQGSRVLFPVVLAGLPLIVLCQVYRYLRQSTRAERAQIKWFVAGLALWLGLGQLLELVAGVTAVAPATQTGLGGDIGDLFALVIPATIGLAILRYRLYDIDVIIRRTLIYSTLTATLGLLYLGSIVVLQALLRPVVGVETELATVVSTLAIAALFQPLRRRIQNVIDRRFYRRKYDAQKTLQAFGEKLRDETDVDQLTGDLVAVVHSTLQPAHVSLWLRNPSGKSNE